MVVGIGSGSTVVYAVERLVQRVAKESIKVKCIPTSYQAELLIIEGKLPLTSLSFEDVIDVTIDGADEIDPELNLIKGGGACQLREKLVAYNSRLLVIIADYRKVSKILCTEWKKGIPIEVLPSAVQPVQRKLKQLGATDAPLRMGVNKAGPVVTDNGNCIIDAQFPPLSNPQETNLAIASIAGVIETGLFVKMATKAFIGEQDGSVSTIETQNAHTQRALDGSH